MEEIRVEVAPEGRAFLLARPGSLAIEAPKVLSRAWVFGVELLAAASWFSRTLAVFRAQLPETPPLHNDSPVALASRTMEPDAQFWFRQPVAVPFRRGRSLWPRSLVSWEPPDDRSPRMLFPPRNVRHGLATSVKLRATGDKMAVLQALELAGLSFPTCGDPS